MSLSDYSEHNIANSLAKVLADKLLEKGYLVYWHAIDAVQTPDQWYSNYSVNQATYLLDSEYSDRVEDAKGLLSVLPKKSAIPRFVTRPTISGIVQPQDSVPIPALSVIVGDIKTGDNYEIGSKLKWRSRMLTIEAFARDETEQAALSDSFVDWFDDEFTFDILDHETGSLSVVGDVLIEDGEADSYFERDVAEATTYEVVFTARLVFVA